MIVLQQSLAELTYQDPHGVFSALMDLYERNYINLRQLLPTIPSARSVGVSHAPGALDLHLTVIERSRYTSELSLTYWFDQRSSSVTVEPNLRIRVYHDARLAEVLIAHPRRHVTYSIIPGNQPHKNTTLITRWKINRFMYKWLSYCLRQGHCFTAFSTDIA